MNDAAPGVRPTPARPTLRMLLEDLPNEYWVGQGVQRHLASDELGRIQHAWWDLPHKILLNISSQVTGETQPDLEPIRCTQGTDLPMVEFRHAAHRAGLYLDDLGQYWICAVGLAKGEHQDHDDFYKALARRADAGTLGQLAPTARDIAMLRRDMATALVSRSLDSLKQDIIACLLSGCPATRLEVVFHKPDWDKPLDTDRGVRQEFTVDLDYDPTDGEMFVGVEPHQKSLMQSALHELLCDVVQRIIQPDRLAWDYATPTTTFCLMDAASLPLRAQELLSRPELPEWSPPEVAHYAHKPAVLGSVTGGDPIKALCGHYFVQTQQPDGLPVCSHCQQVYSSLPESPERQGSGTSPGRQ